MQDFELPSLASTPLSPEEVREVLKRLAIAEFGGADQATIRDVAELTGISSAAVGRIVADIRGESFDDWRKRFDERIDRQDSRITAIEEAVQDPLDQRRLEKALREKREADTQKFVSRALIALLVIVYGGALVALFDQLFLR